MKMGFRRIIALLLVCLLALPTCLGAFAATDEGFLAFVVLFGDKETENDWAWVADGGDVSDEGITATNSYIKVGDTVRVGLEFDSPVINTWTCAPCIVTDGSVSLDRDSLYVDVRCFIDGEEVAVDLTQGAINEMTYHNGRMSWVVGVEDYPENCFRLAGGYDEWSAKYISEPKNFTKIEYEITLNSYVPDDSVPDSSSKVYEAPDISYDLWIALGGDKDASNDWGYAHDSDGVIAVNETIAVGETKTVSLTFPTPVLYTWYCAPCMAKTGSGVGENLAYVDADVVCRIDGQEVAIDFSQGELAWAEGVGSYPTGDCIRLAGGYNEWGAKYIPSPQNFTTIEYTVTLHAVYLHEPEPEIPFDVAAALAKGYNAYFGIQTENWIWRNPYYDVVYGRGSSEVNNDGKLVFDSLAYVNENGEVLNMGGSFTDCIIDGDGTYTVSLDISDVPDVFENETFYNQLHVSTEIPYQLIARGVVTINDVTTSFDGGEGYVFGEITEAEHENADSTTDIVILNTWTIGNGNIPFVSPTDRIDISFTVSGFGRQSSTAVPFDSEASDNEIARNNRSGVALNDILLIVAFAVVLAVADACVCIYIAKKRMSEE